MSMRPKTKRRLLILLVAAIVICMAGVGTYFYLLQQNQQRYQRLRRTGLAAAREQDYTTALVRLGKYLPQHKNDVEALIAYGNARRHVQQAGYAHLLEAIHVYQRVMNLAPGKTEVREQLLKLYTKVGYTTEALQLAKEVLAENPDDFTALRAKAIAYARQREFEKALRAAKKATKVAPKKFKLQLRVLSIMSELERPDAQILHRAASLHEKHPEDPRFILLHAYAYRLIGSGDKAKKLLRSAAQKKPPGPEFAKSLVSRLNRAGLTQLSMKVLKESVQRFEDPLLHRQYALRLWQQGRTQLLLERLASLDPADTDADGGLLGIKAMVLMGEGKMDQAEQILKALEARHGDNAATAWSTLLMPLLDPPDEHPTQAVIDAARNALDYARANPAIYFFLAKAMQKLGRYEQAVEAWKKVAALSPGWEAPYNEAARILLQTNRPRRALKITRQAVKLNPNLDTYVLHARAAYQIVRRNTTETDLVDQLLKEVRQIQQAVPHEPRTLPIYVDLLARSGQTQAARKTLADALSVQQPLPQKTLLQLANLSRRWDLGLSGAAYQAIEKTYGSTAHLVLTRAMRMLREDKKQQAMRLMKSALKKHQSQPLWRMAWAQFLGKIDSERARKQWIKIANAYPDNLEIQKQVLQAPSIRADRDFVAKTLKRIKDITGEQSIVYNMARARWLLRSENINEDVSEAAALLTRIVSELPRLLEARLMLVRALRKLGDYQRAAEHLQVAARLRPDSTQIALQLAQLLLSQGDYAQAREQINRLLNNPAATTTQRRKAAGMLAQLGDTSAAVRLLRQIERSGSDQATPTLLLARLLQRQNKPEKARAVYRKLMRNPTFSVIQAYADFLASTGQMDQARQVLSRLEDLNLSPAARELALAEFYSVHVGAQKAKMHYQSATRLAPDNPVTWRMWITYNLERGRAQRAIAIAEQALQAVPGRKTFTFLTTNASLIRSTASRSDALDMLIAAVRNPRFRAPTIEALQMLSESPRGQALSAQNLRRLSNLGDRYTDFRALQDLLVVQYVLAGRVEEAIRVARAAVQSFPTRAHPAERATRLLAAAGRWSEVLPAVRKWRKRSLTQPYQADMMLVRAHLHLDQPERALDVLQRYISQARKAPQRLATAISLYARALVDAGELERAASVLAPLLSEASEWRVLWMQMTTARIADPDVAADWLRRVAPHIPEDAEPEQRLLAKSWYRLGAKYDRRAYRQRALDQLRTLASRKNPAPQTLMILAEMANRLGKVALAERTYRRLLEIAPDSPAARNNLAMLLAKKQPPELDQALRLAHKAVAALPDVAAIRDTLAYVQLHRGQYDKAVKNYRKAVELEPRNVAWRVGLAHALIKSGRMDQAREALNQINDLAPALDQLPEDVRARLSEIRTRLGRVSSSSSQPLAAP